MNSINTKEEQLLLSELQVLLAEKRTQFALTRSGFAIATVPLSIVAFLIASREQHHLFDFMILTYCILFLLTVMSLIGLSLVMESRVKTKKINTLINKIKSEDKRIAEILV